jgi:hypothetical protein
MVHAHMYSAIIISSQPNNITKYRRVSEATSRNRCK